MGLVSHGGWTCGQVESKDRDSFHNLLKFKVGVYDVYTEVSQYLEWIEMTILDNGGMASCGFTFSAPPSMGKKKLGGKAQFGLLRCATESSSF